MGIVVQSREENGKFTLANRRFSPRVLPQLGRDDMVILGCCRVLSGENRFSMIWARDEIEGTGSLVYETQLLRRVSVRAHDECGVVSSIPQSWLAKFIAVGAAAGDHYSQ